MTPDTVVDWAKAISILGAILFGGFAVFSPSWVWFRIQAFKWGSGLLLGFGTVLLVSPIFRNVQFTVDTQRFELKLSALESQIAQARTSLAALTENFDKLPSIVNAANMSELDRKVQAIQTALTTIEGELPKLAAVADRVKQFEQTAANIDKSAKLLNERTVLLANYINTQQSTPELDSWKAWAGKKYPALTIHQPYASTMSNFKKTLGTYMDYGAPYAVDGNTIAGESDKTTEAVK